MSAEIVPLPGEIAIGAACLRLANLDEELRGFAHEHRQAIAWMAQSEVDLKHAREAIESGDAEAAKRAIDRASKSVGRSRVQRERAAALTEGLASMLGVFRRWLTGAR